tara:strand:- start:291 stop:572 length:282 start_codon:yes stop_codon:yes gene_type:complete
MQHGEGKLWANNGDILTGSVSGILIRFQHEQFFYTYESVNLSKNVHLSAKIDRFAILQSLSNTLLMQWNKNALSCSHAVIKVCTWPVSGRYLK